MKDLTNLKTFIIDSNDPKEIDDAVSLDHINGEAKGIWIHLSYPVKLFEQNSEIDKEARKKSASLYLINDYSSMLPKHIIDKANLNRNKISESISAYIEFNDNGSIKDYKVMETLIKPNYELTYEEANELIDLEPKEEFELIIINNLLKKSIEYRKTKGAIMFNNSYPKIQLKSGKVTIEKVEITEAHKLISESMILMGFVISDYFIKNKIVAPFRSQKINCDINELLKRNSNRDIGYIFLKQYIGKSYTTTKSNKHETLGLKSYIQSTSPLRRYLDLVVQRQIYLYLNNKVLMQDDEINKIIDYSNLRQKELNNIIKEDKLIYLRMFFNNNVNTDNYRIIFIRWVNNKKNIALVYFPEYYLEILVNLYISIDTYPNKIYKVKYNCNDSSNLLEFIN